MAQYLSVIAAKVEVMVIASLLAFVYHYFEVRGFLQLGCCSRHVRQQLNSTHQMRATQYNRTRIHFPRSGSDQQSATPRRTHQVYVLDATLQSVRSGTTKTGTFSWTIL